MNGNNQQRMSPFVRFPEYDLTSAPRAPVKQSRSLVPVEQLMGGGGNSFVGMPEPAMQPQPVMQPQPYDQGQPEGKTKGKTIMGMPKDQFIALMGSIAQAFGGDSASGRMGANLINMAGMMRGERLEKDKARAAEAKAGREAQTKSQAAAAKERKAAQAKKEKVPSEWEATYRSMQGKINPDTNAPYTIGEIRTAYKGIGTKKPTPTKGQAGFEQIEGVWHKGFQHLNPETGGYDFVPTRKAAKAEIDKLTTVKPPAGEKPAVMSFAEKRARAKATKESEAIILNPEYQTAEYQNELQMEIDSFDRYSDKSYTYQLTPGKVVEWGRDVPPKVEKVDISTPEKIMDSNLSDDMKRRLLLKRFPSKFE